MLLTKSRKTLLFPISHKQRRSPWCFNKKDFLMSGTSLMANFMVKGRFILYMIKILYITESGGMELEKDQDIIDTPMDHNMMESGIKT